MRISYKLSLAYDPFLNWNSREHNEQWTEMTRYKCQMLLKDVCHSGTCNTCNAGQTIKLKSSFPNPMNILEFALCHYTAHKFTSSVELFFKSHRMREISFLPGKCPMHSREELVWCQKDKETQSIVFTINYLK